MRPPTKAKRDDNEAIIFAILRAHGIQVHPIDVPCDAICGYKGRTFLIEAKNGTKAKLTPAQVRFRDSWTGHYQVLCSEDEALEWARWIKAGI